MDADCMTRLNFTEPVDITAGEAKVDPLGSRRVATPRTAARKAKQVSRLDL